MTHCRSADPPDAVRKTALTTFPSPAALKLAVRLKSAFFVIVGPLTKCGDPAAGIGAISSNADAASVVAVGMPIFLRPPCIFPRNRKGRHYLYRLSTIFVKEETGLIVGILRLKHSKRLTNLNS